MASPSNQKTGFHARSNSFPSRLNPVITQLDEHLCRSRASEGACTSSSLGGKLSSLQDLHDCVNKRGCVETSLTSEVKKYLTSRKVGKRAIHKALKVIKKNCTFTAFNGDRETTIMFNMLKEVEVVSLKAFDSLLSFISGPEARTTGWSLVSKLVHHKKVASADEEADINEFAKADAALSALVDQNTSKSDNIKGVQTQLESLELCIQDIEEGLEYLSRTLIKTRVSFLNILNH
ncbi:hypothetical protein D5086_018707 [Populus alba]|uniref:Uncharacterized protein n=1 Tax=Populus alba TaxID=43335 RepID=A0ACC4BQI9_POPAL